MTVQSEFGKIISRTKKNMLLNRVNGKCRLKLDETLVLFGIIGFQLHRNAVYEVNV
jgi:hypothetical protein